MFLIIIHFIGPTQFIVLNDIDSAMEMLVKKTTEFAGRPTSPSSMFGSKYNFVLIYMNMNVLHVLLLIQSFVSSI